MRRREVIIPLFIFLCIIFPRSVVVAAEHAGIIGLLPIIPTTLMLWVPFWGIIPFFLALIYKDATPKSALLGCFAAYMLGMVGDAAILVSSPYNLPELRNLSMVIQIIGENLWEIILTGVSLGLVGVSATYNENPFEKIRWLILLTGAVIWLYMTIGRLIIYLLG